jgi:hypothetical protein
MVIPQVCQPREEIEPGEISSDLFRTPVSVLPRLLAA